MFLLANNEMSIALKVVLFLVAVVICFCVVDFFTRRVNPTDDSESFGGSIPFLKRQTEILGEKPDYIPGESNPLDLTKKPGRGVLKNPGAVEAGFAPSETRKVTFRKEIEIRHL